MNDTDILTAEITGRANLAHSGICPACEEPLDPRNPRWAGQYDTRKVVRNGQIVTEPWTPQQEADYLGPALDWAPYHTKCMDAMR